MQSIVTKQCTEAGPDVYLRFVDYLDAQGVEYCFIGPAADYPDNITNDLDLVVRPETLKRDIGDLISRFAASAGMDVVQHVWHQTAAHAFILAPGFSHDCTRLIKLDISTGTVFGGSRFFSGEDIVRGRRHVTGAAAYPGKLFVPDAGTAFVHYLLSKVHDGRLGDDKTRHLSALWQEAPGDARRRTERFWSRGIAERIARCAQSGDWTWPREHLAYLRRRMRLDLRHLSFRGWLTEARRLWVRVTRPTGIHVVVLGPDGAGKTTLIKAIVERLAPLFPRSAQYYLFPLPHDDQGRRPSRRPHALGNWNFFVSTVKLVLWLVRYWAGFLRFILPAKIRSTAIFFDRYYDDLYVDPKRYRYGGAMALARIVGKVVPKPDLYILLDAPADVIWERKKEVPVAETRRQRQAYRRLVSGRANCVRIDAGQSVDCAVSDATSAIMRFMTRRTRERIDELTQSHADRAADRYGDPEGFFSRVSHAVATRTQIMQGKRRR